MRPRLLLMLAVALLVLLPPACGWAQTVVLYSHHDARQARRVAGLARVFDHQVQIDTELQPGVPWRDALDAGICGARRVLLVWSRRAAASVEVAREIAIARHCRVPVVAVLLDSAPLPDDVSQLQGVDWR